MDLEVFWVKKQVQNWVKFSKSRAKRVYLGSSKFWIILVFWKLFKTGFEKDKLRIVWEYFEISKQAKINSN